MPFLLLLGAIAFEVLGTSLLKATDGFTRLWPTVACLSAYVTAFAALAWAIKQELPVGVAYAMWSGLGTAAIVAIGVVFLGESISHPEGRRRAARHRRCGGAQPGRCALTARRDPEARRQQIIKAAVRAIAEVGVGNVTHRQIAALAGVPLGSTTYYFPTLDDLVAAALREATEYSRAGTRGVG